jgi:hypothetical protein
LDQELVLLPQFPVLVFNKGELQVLLLGLCVKLDALYVEILVVDLESLDFPFEGLDKCLKMTVFSLQTLVVLVKFKHRCLDLGIFVSDDGAFMHAPLDLRLRLVEFDLDIFFVLFKSVDDDLQVIVIILNMLHPFLQLKQLALQVLVLLPIGLNDLLYLRVIVLCQTY